MARVASGSLTATACAIALRIFHLELLKEYPDRPWVVAAWLAAELAVVCAAAWLARRNEAVRGTAMGRAWAALDAVRLAYVVLLVILLFAFHRSYARAASDGREYFVQVRSMVIDHDLDFTNENQRFGLRGTAAIYPFGAAIAWSPFFLAGHSWLGLLDAFGGHHARDGYSLPYQMAVGLGSLTWGYVGLLLVHGILARRFTRWLALAATWLVCVGTFLGWYLAVACSMSHAVSFFATTLFVYVWDRTRERRSARGWVALGAAGGLMAMGRWQDVLFLVLPGIEALYDYCRCAARRDAVAARALALQHAVFLAAFLVAVTPQLYFWNAETGRWFAPPSQAHGMQWLVPRVHETLFSANHGLFSWTPLVYLGVIGFAFFARRERLFALGLAVGFALQVYVNATVSTWWGGSGFGARRFASSAVVFALGLAQFLVVLRRHPRFAASLVVVPLAAFNLFFMGEMRDGKILAGSTVRFDQMLNAGYERIGNPFSFPANAWFALHYGGTLAQYDRLAGREGGDVKITMTDSHDEPYLVRGWGSAETDGHATWRPVLGRKASIVVPLKSRAAYRLAVRARIPSRTGEAAAPQRVRVDVNGERAGEMVFERGLGQQLVVPERFWRPGLNEVLLRFSYTVSLAELGLADDARARAAHVESVAVRAIPSATTESPVAAGE